MTAVEQYNVKPPPVPLNKEKKHTHNVHSNLLINKLAAILV